MQCSWKTEIISKYVLSKLAFLLPEADLDGGVQGVRPPKIRKTYVIQR
jgi:hypothetical protein